MMFSSRTVCVGVTDTPSQQGVKRMPDLGLLTWGKGIVHDVTEELANALMENATECDPSMQHFLREDDIPWLKELADTSQDDQTRQQVQQIITELQEHECFSVEMG